MAKSKNSNKDNTKNTKKKNNNKEEMKKNKTMMDTMNNENSISTYNNNELKYHLVDSSSKNNKSNIESLDSNDLESKIEEEKWAQEQLEEDGKILLNKGSEHHKIQLLSIIGEIEGHDVLGNNIKSTKYEHILPMLASIEDSEDIQGVLLLLNTMGGDVEAGLAIAEMISSLSKPTVSLVLGGSHSIGVPIAVSSNYSFIVPTGTMVIHPVRMNGLVIGAQPTYDYFKQMQNRIITFVSKHCNISKKRLETLMMQTGILTKDVGTILVGKEAVEEGLIDEVGGISMAVSKLHEMIEKR